jgi:hypothetical protein
MNMTTAYLTTPRTSSDDRMWRWFYAGKGRSLSLRPDGHGTTRAFLTAQGSQPGEEGWAPGQQTA